MVLMIWTTLQLTWVSMLLFVQLVQISRAMTTYENMRGSPHSHGSRASEAITSALAAGTLSMGGAQLGDDGRAYDPALPSPHTPGHHHHHKEGCFAQWKKILGVDTFVETARHGYEGSSSRSRRNRNPFSRGCIHNCTDFWCDPAPIFGKRENGTAMLGGEVINYTKIYETPLGMSSRTRRGRDNAGGVYQSVAADDSV
jgi:palmitoyltransferase ZDHHC13/17